MQKTGPLWALGTMSGTSLDGVDAAMLLTDGETIADFGPTAYRPYAPAERQTIRAALNQWPGDPAVAAAAEVVETAHATLLAPFRNADLIGFHGQTLAHDPGGRGTHQTGDGALLAQALNLPVVWDFRSNDVALGGQGAPLASFYHFACARWMRATEPLVFLNLGGVGNVTYVDPAQQRPEVPGACLAFDTGPANAPLNDLMQALSVQMHDAGGTVAGRGTPDQSVIDATLNHPYFYRIPPKSLDRNAFPNLLSAVAHLSLEDAAATLTALIAACVARAFEHFPASPSRVLVTGGGRHNITLMQMLSARILCKVEPVEAANLNGDMLEAQAFAYLAVRVLRGLPTSGPTTTGVRTAVGGGQISRP